MLKPSTYGRLRGIRLQSTAARSAAPADIARWIDTLTAATPVVAEERLDPERLGHLHATLPTRLKGTSAYLDLPSTGPAVVPKAHHLIYFQPNSVFTDLGADGSSTEYNAPAPYLRRMWAGGSFEWSSTSKALAAGSLATQVNSVASAEFKKGMIFVNQKRDFYHGTRVRGQEAGGNDWSVREIRTHVFRQGVTGNAAIKAKAQQEAGMTPPQSSPLRSFTYTPTAALLFRYSALTYNAHRIHYDRDWCRSVEGHPDLVVHGPLTATLLVEMAEKVALDSGRELRRFDYRATSPMYVDREMTMEATVLKGQEDKVELVARQEGRVGMKAVATFI